MKILLFILCAVIFIGCSIPSAYVAFYEQGVSDYDLQYLKENRPEVFLKDNQEPQVRYYDNEDNMKSDMDKLFNDGCILIGRSTFHGELKNVNGAKSKAKDIKSPLVLIMQQYSHTEEETGVYAQPTTSTTNYNGGYGRYIGTSKTTSTTYVPYTISIQIYDQGAFFYLCD